MSRFRRLDCIKLVHPAQRFVQFAQPGLWDQVDKAVAQQPGNEGRTLGLVDRILTMKMESMPSLPPGDRPVPGEEEAGVGCFLQFLSR